MELTETDLTSKEFSQITFGQRKALLRVISGLKAPGVIEPSSTLSENTAKTSLGSTEGEAVVVTSSPILSPDVIKLAEDLGCCEIGVLDDDGYVTPYPSTSKVNEPIDPSFVPCMSSSIMKVSEKCNDVTVGFKRSPEQLSPLKKSPPKKKKRYNFDVMSLLKKTKVGRDVINHVAEHHSISRPINSQLLEIVCRSFCSHGALKYYPSKRAKQALADAIVEAFPDLADTDGSSTSYYNPLTSTGYIQTKLNFLRKKELTPSKRMRQKKRSGEDKMMDQNNTDTTLNESELESLTENEVQEKVNWMRTAKPSKSLEISIAESLAVTFHSRRAWIHKCEGDRPTCTDVLDIYPHLISYGGAMIDGEFLRLFPQHIPLADAFVDIKPAVLKYSASNHTGAFKDSEKFVDENVRAVCLMANILTYPLPKKFPAELRKVMELNKSHLTKLPSSAFLQIIAEGEDVESHHSVERMEGKRKKFPVPPYLVWATNCTSEGGEFYLKIDRKTMHIATMPCSTIPPIVRALDILFKAYHVFDLDYHPHILGFFDFLESSYGIRKKVLPPTVAAVTKFVKNFKQMQG